MVSADATASLVLLGSHATDRSGRGARTSPVDTQIDATQLALILFGAVARAEWALAIAPASTADGLRRFRVLSESNVAVGSSFSESMQLSSMPPAGSRE